MKTTSIFEIPKLLDNQSKEIFPIHSNFSRATIYTIVKKEKNKKTTLIFEIPKLLDNQSKEIFLIDFFLCYDLVYNNKKKQEKISKTTIDFRNTSQVA